jgi:N-acetyl-alpha-D-glucosaminyl L-malate synthase BshA
MVRIHDIQILHYHYAQPFAALINGLPQQLGIAMPQVVGTFHGTDLTRYINDLAAIQSLSRSLKTTTVVTTVSYYMLELAHKTIPEYGNFIKVENFLEPKCYLGKRATRAELQRVDKPVMAHISNFRPVKNTIAISELFARVHEQVESELWLIGDGPELPNLIDSVTRRSGKQSVKHFGTCLEVEQILGGASFILSTSLEESFGLSILEAMACGVVPIASAVGGIPELVKNNYNGILFNLDNIQSTATRIVQLLQAPHVIEKMQQHAASRAKDFHETHVITQYEAVYNQVLQI